MTDAREIIADELDKCICPADPWANAVINRLHAAGYRILGPDEVDPVTVERAAEVAANWGSEIPAEIRALGRKA